MRMHHVSGTCLAGTATLALVGGLYLAPVGTPEAPASARAAASVDQPASGPQLRTADPQGDIDWP